MTTSQSVNDNQAELDAELSRLRAFEQAINVTETLTKTGHYEWNCDLNCLASCSDQYAHIFDMTLPQVMQSQSSWDDKLKQIHVDDVERYQRAVEAMSQAETLDIQYRIQLKDNRIKHIREICVGTSLLVRPGQFSVGFLQDITEQMNQAQAQQFKSSIVHSIEVIANIGYFLFDEELDRYLLFSPGQAHIIGLDIHILKEKIITRDDYIALIYEEDQAQVRKAYEHHFHEDGQWKVEYRVLKADGQLSWILEVGKTFKRNMTGVEQSIGFIRDITRQKLIEQELLQSRYTLEKQVRERTRELRHTVKQLEEQIEERKKVEAELDFQANHDALTGLPSLRLCKDRLERSLAEARRDKQMIAVMFLDLDGFKKINDTLGHDSGDRVLIAIAKRIQQEIRETDTVARIGGDKFVIIMSKLSEVSAVQNIVSKLIKQVSKPLLIDQQQVSISASIGIALYPNQGKTADQLIRVADKAMYEVKKTGKNDFAFADMAASEDASANKK